MCNISEAISFQRRDQVWETLLGIQTLSLLLLLLQGNYTDSCVEICRLKVCWWTWSRRRCTFISALSACFHFNVQAVSNAGNCKEDTVGRLTSQSNIEICKNKEIKIQICASSKRSGREVENNSPATDSQDSVHVFPFHSGLLMHLQWCHSECVGIKSAWMQTRVSARAPRDILRGFRVFFFFTWN